MLQAFEKLSLTNSEHYTQLSSSQLPDILRNSAHIRKLDSLIITNFKSFSIFILIQKARFMWGHFYLLPPLWDRMGLVNPTFSMLSCFVSAIKKAN